jgi:hypothetical protein
MSNLENWRIEIYSQVAVDCHWERTLRLFHMPCGKVKWAVVTRKYDSKEVRCARCEEEPPEEVLFAAELAGAKLNWGNLDAGY